MELYLLQIENKGLEPKILSKVQNYVNGVVQQIIQKYSNYLSNGISLITQNDLGNGKKAIEKYLKPLKGFEKYRKEISLLFDKSIQMRAGGDFTLISCKNFLGSRDFNLNCGNVCKKPNVFENEEDEIEEFSFSN
jgi:hypothetical protein